MNVSKVGINQYLKAVAGKLNSPATTRMLQFGTKNAVKGQPILRDNEGLLSTKTGILDSAQMLFAATSGRDELVSKFQNFSVGNNQPSTGVEAVADVKTVGAIDLTIIARAQSIIPFVAVDRSMKNQIDTLYYNDLVAVQDAAGVKAGEVVDGNFLPPNSKARVDSKRAAADGQEFTGTAEVKAGTEIVPGSVKVKVTLADGTVFKGRDFAGDGQIMFAAAAGVTEATVDYDTGDITVKAAGTSTIKVMYTLDAHADNNEDYVAKDVLVVAPKWTAVQLESTEDNIIVQDNLANRLNMQKVQLLATDGAGGTSAADITFGRTKNAYLEAMNRKVLRPLCKAATVPEIEYDLSGYDLGSWNTTKNDQVTQLMTNLEAKFLGETSIPLTAIITGSMGVALLQCIPNMWTPNPDAGIGLNGLAGYFNGKPVYRHNYLNALSGAKYASDSSDSGAAKSAPVEFYGVAKLPDNNSGSVVFGEYLPLTSTGVVSNYYMPTNISNGFFSMTGAKVVSSNLVMKVVIIPPVATFGTGVVGGDYGPHAINLMD